MLRDQFSWKTMLWLVVVVGLVALAILPPQELMGLSRIERLIVAASYLESRLRHFGRFACPLSRHGRKPRVIFGFYLTRAQMASLPRTAFAFLPNAARGMMNLGRNLPESNIEVHYAA
jgi:hypothetical protein